MAKKIEVYQSKSRMGTHKWVCVYIFTVHTWFDSMNSSNWKYDQPWYSVYNKNNKSLTGKQCISKNKSSTTKNTYYEPNHAFLVSGILT